MTAFQLEASYAAPGLRSVCGRNATAIELKTDFLRNGRLLLRTTKRQIMRMGWDSKIEIAKGGRSDSGAVTMLLTRQGCRYGLMVRLCAVPEDGRYWHHHQRNTDSILIDVYRCHPDAPERVVGRLVSWHPMDSEQLAERLITILKTMPT